MEETYILSEIWVYPIKSLGGIRVSEAVVQARGLQYDRRWMLVDESGIFLSQRTFPEMALLQVELTADELIVSHKQRALSPLRIPLQFVPASSLSVRVWDDELPAQHVNNEADAWFSQALDRSCRLVYQSEQTQRYVDTKYAHHSEITSFADGYPFMIIGQSSLNDLNSRLSEPLPMNRFRPNLVFTGGFPFVEDRWYEFRIGQQTFFSVKPCARCVLTTVNQETAQKGKEPLKTLSQYRNWNKKIIFGQNLLPGSTLATITEGNFITIVSTKEPPLL
ncbi:MAG: MOSC domain-containing protein [Siphonobacter sp.]